MSSKGLKTKIISMKRENPRLQQIIRNFVHQPNHDLEAFKQQVSNYWQNQGYNVDVIEMAFKYSAERAMAAMKPITMEDIRTKVYPLYFASEIETADNWLLSLRKMLQRTL